MAASLTAIAATDSVTRHADWLEINALTVADSSSSLQDLIQVVRRSGTTDAATDDDPRLAQDDRGSETSQAVAEAAFAEVESRAAACGGAYPFRVRGQRIDARPATDRSIYVFLLLLSLYGGKAGPSELSAFAIFDDVAAQASKTYIGGDSYVFAFPRRVAPKGFCKALDDLILQMGEGQGNRRRPQSKNQKDAKLDIVSWRAFEDKRPGKIIAFGQCATGSDWKSKLSELQPRAFAAKWLLESLVVEPIRLFFMPFRVPEDEWLDIGYDGGIVFDRCRLANHGRGVSREVLGQVKAWNSDVLTKKVRA